MLLKRGKISQKAYSASIYELLISIEACIYEKRYGVDNQPNHPNSSKILIETLTCFGIILELWVGLALTVV